jgi:hypothetical protein
MNRELGMPRNESNSLLAVVAFQLIALNADDRAIVSDPDQ